MNCTRHFNPAVCHDQNGSTSTSVSSGNTGAAAAARPTVAALLPRRARADVGADPYAVQVDAGVAYLQQRAAQQLPLVRRLQQALQGGYLLAAQDAY